MMTAESMADMQLAASHLKNSDAQFAKLVKKYGVLEPCWEADYFPALVRKIVSQQLSVKAANTIFSRYRELVGDKLNPENLLRFDQETCRTAGVSRQKFNYIQDLCKHYLAAPSFFAELDTQSDEAVCEHLTAVKGIGVWTAKMFLIFNLGRIDIFSTEDVGLQNAIQGLYNLEEKPSKKEMVSISMPWAPYRSVASRYLWKWLDNTP